MPYTNPFAAPTAPAGGGGSSGYQNPFSSGGSLRAAPASAAVPQTAPKVSGTTTGIPNQALEGNLGGGYGTSNVKDSSGKPLLTYENVGAQASQLLPDRVAPTFDPAVAQKMTPDMLQNGRMPESASSKIKSTLGGTSSDELDHQIALELSGSNDNSNLKIEPDIAGTKNTATDPLENVLAKKVVAGQVSLIDAQRQLAVAKGYDLPEFGGAQPQQGKFPVVAPQPTVGEKALQFFPSTMQSIAEFGMDPFDLKADPSKTISDYWNGIKAQVTAEEQNIADVFAARNPAERTGGILKSVAGLTAVISPITSLFAAGNDIPILGTATKLLMLPFEVMGDAGKPDAQGIVNALVAKKIISQDTGNKIVDGLGQIIGLAGQFAVGGAAESITKGLSEKFGATDANTIIDLAKEKGTEIKANPDIAEAQKPTLTDLADEKTAAAKAASAPKPETGNTTDIAKTGTTLDLSGKPEAVAGEPVTDIVPPKTSNAAPDETSNAAKPVSDEIVKPTRRAGTLKPIEGTGETKIRGLSEGVEAKAIENKLTENFGDLPEYKTVSMKDQAEKASTLLAKDPEGARAIAMGDKAVPKGMIPEAVYIAVENDAIARGDAQMLKELANSRLTGEATTMGQRIRTLGERDPESPTDAIRAVQEAREKASRSKVAEETQKAQESIRRATADRVSGKTKISWNDFISAITC